MPGAHPVTQKPAPQTLTDAAVYALPVPLTRYALRDRHVTQLVLLVGQRSRTWYLHGTVRQTTHRVRLGRFPLLGTEQARSACLDALRRLYAGEPATVQVTPKRAPPTLSQVLDEYVTMRSLGPKATADLRSVIRVHAKDWADAPVDALDAHAVARYYRGLAQSHPAPANRLLAALSALTRFAAASHKVGDASLIPRVKSLLGGAQPVHARDTVIPDDLLPAWGAQVNRLPPTLGRYFRALLLTGMRANELRGVPVQRWDAAAGVLHVDMTKNGKPHALPVGPTLRTLLEAEAREGRGVLFDVREDDYRAACAQVGESIGLRFHLHDLRRTFGTLAVRLGVDAFTVKRLMNHSAGNDVTAKHYVKLAVDDLRPAMNRIDAHLTAAWTH